MVGDGVLDDFKQLDTAGPLGMDAQVMKKLDCSKVSIWSTNTKIMSMNRISINIERVSIDSTARVPMRPQKRL